MTNEELKEARKQRAFTQQQMADELGVPVSTYRKWEQGDRKVPGLVAGQLAGKKLALKHLGTAEMLAFIRKTGEAGLDPEAVIADLIRGWSPENEGE